MDTNLNGESIVVGREGCPINDIVRNISNSDVVKGKALEFARILAEGTGLDVKKEYKDYEIYGKFPFSEFLITVLNYWIAYKVGNATLSALLRVLEADCNDRKAGETLRLHFSLPCMDCENPELKWSDLSDAFQNKVHTTLVESNIFREDDIKEMKPNLSKIQLIGLMKGEPPIKALNSMEVNLC